MLVILGICAVSFGFGFQTSRREKNRIEQLREREKKQREEQRLEALKQRANYLERLAEGRRKAPRIKLPEPEPLTGPSIGQGCWVTAHCPNCSFRAKRLRLGMTAFGSGGTIDHVIAYTADGTNIIEADAVSAEKAGLTTIDPSEDKKWKCPRCLLDLLTFSPGGVWYSD